MFANSRELSVFSSASLRRSSLQELRKTAMKTLSSTGPTESQKVSHIDMEGYLKKLKRSQKTISLSAWNTRYFWLDGHSQQLLYYKSKKSCKNKTPSGGFRLEDIDSLIFLQQEAATSKQFTIQTKDRTFTLRANTTKDFQAWQTVLTGWAKRNEERMEKENKKQYNTPEARRPQQQAGSSGLALLTGSATHKVFNESIDENGTIVFSLSSRSATKASKGSPASSVSTMSNSPICRSNFSETNSGDDESGSPEAMSKTCDELRNINSCDFLENDKTGLFEEEGKKTNIIDDKAPLTTLTDTSFVDALDEENQEMDASLEALKKQSELCLQQFATVASSVHSQKCGSMPLTQELKRDKHTKVPPPPPSGAIGRPSGARKFLLNMKTSPGTTVAMIERASMKPEKDNLPVVFSYDDTGDDCSQNEEEKSTSVQHYCEAEEEASFGQSVDGVEIHTYKSSTESKYAEDAYGPEYVPSSDEAEEVDDMWLVDKSTWDSDDSDEENKHNEHRDDEDAVYINHMGETHKIPVDYSAWDSSDDEVGTDDGKK